MRIKVFALAAVFAAMATAAMAQTGQVKIENAWARATPSGATTAAVYLTLEASAADKLVAVSTPAARAADLHMMSMENGIMKMRALPAGIDLPAGKAVTLKPGGMHIMLSALTGPLTEGETIPLTLNFEKSGTQQVSVPVEKVGAMAPAGSGMGGMKMGH